ncbi:MAG: thymidine phosphorylase, partial [Proteobacteria bacterium]|nr:thymidine phosphorylase [Pseudomonadota bacterium]
MLFQEILGKKRDRKPLSKKEIEFFVRSYTENSIPDYQASALLMAIYINGLSPDETAWLTEAMLHSGIVVDLAEIPGIKVDKHSTGGVGDKTSLIATPICAAMGIPVPMISGRGLEHTGGTLDKLESIPGFETGLDLDSYRKIVAETGACLIGQTREIAPADGKLYALRDVTCTVGNKSLIAASIMSKKLAEGIDALVLDVKTGRGAFMRTVKEAEELASLLISIGRKMGKRVTALVTDMNQPLGSHVGNALEVVEAVQLLKGQCRPEQRDLLKLSTRLAAHMAVLGGKASDVAAAEKMVGGTIDDLSAFDKFKEIVLKQGGDPSVLDHPSKLPTAVKNHGITAPSDGFIRRLDALLIGKASVLLGAGRESLDSTIDYAVGAVLRKKIGDRVAKDETIM